MNSMGVHFKQNPTSRVHIVIMETSGHEMEQELKLCRKIKF